MVGLIIVLVLKGGGNADLLRIFWCGSCTKDWTCDQKIGLMRLDYLLLGDMESVKYA